MCLLSQLLSKITSGVARQQLGSGAYQEVWGRTSPSGDKQDDLCNNTFKECVVQKQGGRTEHLM